MLRYFTYVLRKLVLALFDLPSVVLKKDDFFVFFLPSHDISDLKISKLCPLLKGTQFDTKDREQRRKSKNI